MLLYQMFLNRAITKIGSLDGILPYLRCRRFDSRPSRTKYLKIGSIAQY